MTSTPSPDLDPRTGSRIESLLARVERPARYVGGELNSITKPWHDAQVRLALVYPDIYEVGMSNLGLRILYYVVNAQPSMLAERAFAPATDMERLIRDAGIPLFSLESHRSLSEFDIVGFSLAYELAYPTVLNLLDLSGIPVDSKDRTDAHPIVIAGGHCATNPEPMADFIDAFVIGDGEQAIIDVAEAVRANRSHRADALRALEQIAGVYVPTQHDAGWRFPNRHPAGGASGLRPAVRARIVTDFENAPFPDTLILPAVEAVHDRVAVEIMRGCTRGCRFCQAGMITRPVRERSVGKLCEQAAKLLEATGYDEVALTSLSSADHSGIGELVKTLIDQHKGDRVGVSLPSLRADAACVELAAQIQRVRKSGLTLAPEAGTQRLRDVINKNVTEADLLDAVRAAVASGWRRVKLYFMIGLPEETDEDVEGIAHLVNRVAGAGGRGFAVTVTLSPFVPKPHTPFQWRAMDSPGELRRKVGIVRALIGRRGITVNWHDPESSRVEAALARGDRNVGCVIAAAWRAGATLAQERFSSDTWIAAFESCDLDIAHYANREISLEEALPWEHIHVGVSRDYLWAENQRANQGITTPDCRTEGCSACGVSALLSETSETTCKEVTASRLSKEVVVTEEEQDWVVTEEEQDWVAISESPPSAGPGFPAGAGFPNPAPAMTRTAAAPAEDEKVTLVLFLFSKTGRARWLGHLDLMRAFERAIRMSKVNVVYSEGFNPRPRVAVLSALPLGATADADVLAVRLWGPLDARDLIARINARLPEGIRLVGAQPVLRGLHPPAIEASEFRVEISVPETAGSVDLEEAVQEFLAGDNVISVRKSDGKSKEFNIRHGVWELHVTDFGSGSALLTMVLPRMEFTVKPAEVVTALSAKVPGLSIVSVHRSKLILGR